MTPYDPGQDVIEVIRPPAPGPVAGAYRAFGATLKGLKTTFARIVEGPTTIQYPEEKTPVYPRFRGRHKLHRFEDTGLEKCVGCSLGVVLMRNPFYSVIMLIVHLICLAALYLLLRAEFVAATQVIVYAGAVMVLYLFVVAYVGGGAQLPGGAVLKILGPLFGL